MTNLRVGALLWSAASGHGLRHEAALSSCSCLVALLASAAAHAATITIPSGSSQSQIQTYFNSATSTNNVIQFQAGTYAVGSGSLTLPCVSGGVTITGPAVPLNYTRGIPPPTLTRRRSFPPVRAARLYSRSRTAPTPSRLSTCSSRAREHCTFPCRPRDHLPVQLGRRPTLQLNFGLRAERRRPGHLCLRQ